MTLFKTLLLIAAIVSLCTGCATDQNSPAGTTPTIGGYLDTGVQKKF
ncbi:MAG: hypothetical protein P4N60_04115 [Verrucomicrobiae bacterium]|nr:hypothetical protein [Verrucomicrobiae bacterium]